MYKVLIRPILFTIDPERAHRLVFRKLRFFQAIPGFTAITRAVYGVEDPQLEREVFGIRFPNPVGMAAGFDKDAVLYKALGAYGFGFVEIGTLTPRAQPGNPRPRLFRLPADKALINRMGFNNGGVEAAVRRLRRRNPNLIIGGNIGKNKNTPNEEATADYVTCFNALFDHVDYFAINVSSPNTPNLRELQDVKPLTELLHTLESLNRAQAQRKPILLKIAPDVSDEQLVDFVTIIRDTGIDGIIATNTTVDRSGLRTDKRQVKALGPGGLSGAPLRNRSTEVISRLSELSRGDFPIVAVGGIFTADDVREKLDAGASLVQIYTGFVYEGPGMVRRILRELIARRN